ncbi:MAG: 7-cyano-7-deazaguanine reductase [Pseudohongiellaceae bacterium]|jgi:7-cyano-7-deazaguanine reductase
MTLNPLGSSTRYPQNYQPKLLHKIPRLDNRTTLGIADKNLPFSGADIWNAYELSCLDKLGKPQIFLGRFVFPADTPNLIESKSLKLYLNSLNQEKFDSVDKLKHTIQADLSQVAGGSVLVILQTPEELAIPELPAGICLDDLDVEINDFTVNPELLRTTDESLFDEITDEVLFTNLFRSNCPITNQPDWATITVCYHGKKIPHQYLLKYLVSYRQHNDYHENCVERIFCDLVAAFSPLSLTVEANFLRRGGLDINPVRTTESGLNYQAFPRYLRQ